MRSVLPLICVLVLLASPVLGDPEDPDFERQIEGGNEGSETSPSDWDSDTSVDDIASYCADNGCTDADLTNIPSDKRADFFAHEDTNWNDYSAATLEKYSSDLNMNSDKGRNFLLNADFR